jgi:hypothetical protein
MTSKIPNVGGPHVDDVSDGPHVGAQDPEERTAELREDIEQTRQELGETVAQLAYRVDVKSRVKARTAVLRERPLVPLTAVLGALLTLLGYLWWRRH